MKSFLVLMHASRARSRGCSRNPASHPALATFESFVYHDWSSMHDRARGINPAFSTRARDLRITCHNVIGEARLVPQRHSPSSCNQTYIHEERWAGYHANIWLIMGPPVWFEYSMQSWGGWQKGTRQIVKQDGTTRLMCPLDISARIHHVTSASMKEIARQDCSAMYPSWSGRGELA